MFHVVSSFRNSPELATLFKVLFAIADPLLTVEAELEVAVEPELEVAVEPELEVAVEPELEVPFED
jgi:hypothetical protein